MLADLTSLYFVAITVGVAAFAGFRSFSLMMDAANIFPGEQGNVDPSRGVTLMHMCLCVYVSVCVSVCLSVCLPLTTLPTVKSGSSNLIVRTQVGLTW